MLEPKQIDSLTGFYLRGSFHPFIERLMLDSRRDNTDFSIVYIDVDRFKRFNDTFGHSFGDRVLEHVTNILQSSFKEYRCQFFRYGGDEFIVVFMDKGSQDARRAVQKCTLNFRKNPFLLKDKYHNITISCGIATYPIDGLAFEELIQKADKAMYFSKGHGRNLITLAGRMRYLGFRNNVIWISVACAFIWLIFFIYQTNTKLRLKIKKIMNEGIIAEPRVKDKGIPPEKRIEDERIISETRDLTVIILKDGKRLEGQIISETENSIKFRLYLSVGKMVMNVNKSRIARIEHN